MIILYRIITQDYMKILITGFEPFGGESTNPAYEAVKLLPNKVGEHVVIKAEIPTAFYESVNVLRDLMKSEMPEVIICVGQAGGRTSISIERVAINIDDARIPDNLGQSPIDEPIVRDGPAAYFSTLPIKAMTKAIRESGIPAEVSNTAGTYVCNHVMYGLLHIIQKKHPKARGGFIHVPYSEAQVLEKGNTPSMNLHRIAKALEIAIETACEIKVDPKYSGGAIS